MEYSMTQRVPSITEADGSTVVAAGTEAAVALVTDGPSTQARTEAIGVANTEALAWLRDQYRAEFNAKKIELVKAAGYDWTPRPTDEQKAEAEVQKILARYPGLRDRIGTDVPIPFE